MGRSHLGRQAHTGSPNFPWQGAWHLPCWCAIACCPLHGFVVSTVLLRYHTNIFLSSCGSPCWSEEADIAINPLLH